MTELTKKVFKLLDQLTLNETFQLFTILFTKKMMNLEKRVEELENKLKDLAIVVMELQVDERGKTQ